MTDASVSHPSGRAELREPSAGAYDWLILALLLVCYTLAFMDARLPQILIESIKSDLRLSDTQIGLITGPAFSLTYALAVIPIARLSDRYSRKYVIAGSVAAWSALTAAAGFANSFLTLLLTRVGVAIGEGGLTPASHALISARFPDWQRSTAIAIFSCGIPIGIALSMIIGGKINDLYGWRAAMFLVGGCGFFLSIVVLLLLREPLRNSAAATAAEGGQKTVDKEQDRERETFRSLFSDPVIRYTIIAGTLTGIASGASAWLAPYAIRAFDLSSSQVGASFGAVLGVTTLLGTLFGGTFTAWLSRNDPRRGFWFLAAVSVLGAGLNLLALTRDAYAPFLTIMCFSGFILTLYPGPIYAAVQSRAKPASRSFASAVALFCKHGLGLSLGTFLTGLMSDYVFVGSDAERLRWALVTVMFSSALGGVSFYLASRHARTPRPDR